MAKKHDILFIADEIATGFWRTGHRFACEAADVRPDILCLGKALTGGTMTMGATLASEEVFEAFLSDDWDAALMHGPTFMANPLACAAANASLDLFEREPKEGQVEQIEAGLREGLEPCRSMPGVVDVRVSGAIGVVQLAGGTDVYALRPRFVEQGVWVRPFKDIVYLMPPLVIEDDELDILMKAVRTRPERAVMPDFALTHGRRSMRNAARSLRFVLLLPLVLCATATGRRTRDGEDRDDAGHEWIVTSASSPSTAVRITFFASEHKATDQGSFHAGPRQAGEPEVDRSDHRPAGWQRKSDRWRARGLDGRARLSRSCRDFTDGVARARKLPVPHRGDPDQAGPLARAHRHPGARVSSRIRPCRSSSIPSSSSWMSRTHPS